MLEVSNVAGGVAGGTPSAGGRKADAMGESATTGPATVYLGMSGGVDSSLSAVLLKEQGYKVVGVYMKNWSKNLPGMKCPWAEDLADAKRVATRLGIDFKVFDFEKEYKQKVVDYMLDEFKKGNTPNPDIMCNQEIKFKLFYDVAMEQGADFIATGHYARVAGGVAGGTPDGRSREAASAAGESAAAGPATPMLLRAVDENKDQTYFLYRISDDALRHTIFPIGDMYKQDVKALAAEKGLANAYKKESMGICFVGEVGIKDFLKEYIDQEPGEIRELETDKKLGMHEGAIFYTVGQRHGLNIGGGLPYYVAKKDVKKNIVYVSQNLNAADLWTDELKLKDIVLRNTKAGDAAGGDPSAGGRQANAMGESATTGPATNLQVRLRHRAPLIPAILDGDTVKFKEKIKAPASGQSVVFYDGEVCLGGGIIE